MIAVRVSGDANLGPIQRQVVGLTASVVKLSMAMDDSMDAARAEGPKKAREQYRAWEQQMESSRYELNQLTRAMGTFDVSSMKVTRSTDALADSIQKSKFGLTDFITRQRELTELYKRQVSFQNSLGVQYGHTEAGSARIDVHTPKAFEAQAKRVDEARRKLGFYGQVMDSVSTKTLNWGKNTQWAGRQLMAGITYPMALAAAGTVKYAYDMDKALTQIVKVYGDNADKMAETDESIRESATNTAKFLARTYGQSFEDSLEIQSQLASTGKTGPELQQSTIAVSRARLLGELNIQDAMKATISLQEVYRMDSEKLAETFAYMNTMENQTSLTMQDFVVGLPKVSGIMKTLNADVEETGVLFAAMKTAGIDAKEGGNAIKSIVFKDLAPSSIAAKKFVELTGQSLENLKIQTGGEVIPMLQAIGQAMDGLGSTDRVAIMSQVFGIHQGSKALGLVDALTSAIKDSDSQVAQAMKIANMTPEEHMEIASGELRTLANSDWNKAQRGIQSIKIAIAELGEVILATAGPALEGIGRVISKMADSFNGASPFIQKTILTILGLTAVAGPIVMLAGLMGNLGSKVLTLGAFFMKTAGSGMKIYTEKQNAARLASDQFTDSVERQGTALNRQMALMTAMNNTTIRTMQGGTPAESGAYMSTLNTAAQGAIQNTGVIKNGSAATNASVNSARAIAEASGKTAKDWDKIAQNAGIAATAAGAFGMMSTESGTLMNNLSNAAFFASILGPSIARGLKPLFSQSSKLTGMLGLMPKAGGAVSTWASKAGVAVKALGGSLLGIAGPIGIATVAAGGLFYMFHKRAKEAAAAQDFLNNSVGEYAKVLNISLSTERKFKTGADTNKASSYTQLADQLLASNKDGERAMEMFRNDLEKMGSDTDRKNAIRNYGMQKGMEARVAGATAEEAKEIARVAAISVDKEFAESMIFSINVDSFIRIDDVTSGQIDTVRRKVQDIFENKGEKPISIPMMAEVTDTTAVKDGTGTFDIGTDENGKPIQEMFQRFQLTPEAKQEIAFGVDKSWAAFRDLDGAAMQKAFQKMSTDSYGQMQEFYEDLTASQEAVLRSEGVVDGRTLAEFAQKLGGTDKLIGFLNKEGVALSEAQRQTVQENLLTINQIMQEYAKKMDVDPEKAAEMFKNKFDFNEILKLDAMSQRGVKAAVASFDQISAAQRQYKKDMLAAKLAGDEWSLPKKQHEAQLRSEALGLTRVTDLTKDWTTELTHNADAIDKNGNAIAEAEVKRRRAANNPYYTNGPVDSEGFQRGGVMKIDASKVTSDQFVAAYKDGMTAMNNEMTDYASNAMEESHDLIIQGLDKENETAMAAFDKQGEAIEARFERDAEEIETRYEKLQETFDSNWEKKIERFDKKWSNRMKRFDKEAETAKKSLEASYDSRIEKIEKAIKAEQDAESARQKIFENEKARIQQYANLANMAIDINMAISSGNLDEAAKLSNDAQASIESYEMDDAAANSQSASDKKIAGLEKTKTSEEKAKDRALEALEERQKAERERLEEQQKNAKKALDIQKETDQKALNNQKAAERKRLEQLRESERKALENSKKTSLASYEDKKRREDQKFKAAKKALDEEIQAVLAAAPRTEEELNANLARLEKAYGNYGGGLKKKGDEWAFIVRDRLEAHMRQARRVMMGDVGWDQMGDRIANRMAQGSFGMSLGKFKNWLGLGASQQNKTASSAANAGANANVPDGSRSTVGGVTRHSGGMIDRSKGDRTGYSGNNLAPSEVMVRALEGESVLNRKATARLGKSGVDALNRGKNAGIGDGPGFGGLPGLMMAGFMKPLIEKAVVTKGAEQQAKDAAAQVSAITGGASSRFEAFWKALAKQESGGDYGAVNRQTGALGKYQVMPGNVKDWSKAALGRSITPAQFLANPKYQDAIMKHVLGGYFKKWGARGAAAAWYAGPANHDLHMSTRPQFGGPSIKAYVDNIVKMMNQILASSPKPSGGGGPGGAGGNKVWEAMGWQKMWPIVANKFPHANKTSDYRKDSITSSGNLSYHAMSRAIDITSDNGTDGMMWIFKWLRRMFGSKSKEIIYSPAGGQQIKNGQNLFYTGRVRDQHWDHVHWAMRNGGLVPGRGPGDRTRIMGEPGEFMLRKKAVEHVGLPMLQLLNSDKFINMPNTKTVTANGAAPASVDNTVNNQYTIKIDARGNPHGDDVAAQVEKVLRDIKRREGDPRRVGRR